MAMTGRQVSDFLRAFFPFLATSRERVIIYSKQKALLGSKTRTILQPP
jgi:hypothetical protein